MSGNSVNIVGTSIVKPAEETPLHSIWLSNLDLLSVRRAYVPLVWVYRSGGGDADSSSSSFAKLKESLSRTLVAFYPYAGTLGHDDKGRVELRCDGGGVEATEAVCDATLEEFGVFSPNEDTWKHLVPLGKPAVPPCPVCMFQVTRFKCGGVCLGTSVHHFIGDGIATMYLINSWAAVTRGVDPRNIKRPLLDRTVLSARSPPRVEYDHGDLALRYNIPSNPSTKETRLSTATLRISKEQLVKLKAAAKEGAGATTFTVVVAHAWRCICQARGLDGGETTRLFIPVDIRGRLTPPLSRLLLVNAVLFVSVQSKVSDLLFGDDAKTIANIEASKTRLHDSYLRSLVDFLELEKASMDEPWALQPNDISAVSWLQLPFSEVDFGRGRPTSVAQASPPYRGGLYVMRSPKDDGEVQLLVTLEEDHMPAFKKSFLHGAI